MLDSDPVAKEPTSSRVIEGDPTPQYPAPWQEGQPVLSSTIVPLGLDSPIFESFVSLLPTPWAVLPEVSPEAARMVEAETWRRRFESGTTGWLALSGERSVGAITFEPLALDSELFHQAAGRSFLFLPGGLDEGRVALGRGLLEQCLARAREAGIEHLSVRVSVREPSATMACEEEELRLMATKCVLALACVKRPVPQLEGVSLRPFRPEDERELGALAAATSYPFSRFNLEPSFTPADKAAFYRTWATNGVRSWARWAFVAEARGRLVGYGLWQEGPVFAGIRPTRLVDHTLGGVLPELRRKGIFQALTLAGLNRAAESGYDIQTGVINVNNLACQRAYLGLGASLVGGHYTFHGSFAR